MAPAHNIAFAQWAEKTYGSSSMSTHNTSRVSDIEYLVSIKYLKDLSTSGLVYPTQQPSPPCRFHGPSPSLSDDNYSATSTPKTKPTPLQSSAITHPNHTRFPTTANNIWLDPASKNIWLDPTDFSANAHQPHPGISPILENILLNQKESSTTTNPTRPEFAAATKTASLKRTTATTQKNITTPEPELPPLEIDHSLWYPDPIALSKWFRSRSRVEQLEYLVKIKIDTFREKLRVHVPLYTRQWYIDGEEDRRRRKFFKKNGEEAYRARYIDSDYTGHVEFLYIPMEVQ